MLASLEASAGPAQDEVLNRVCRLVFPHAFAEESVLWPVLRRVLPDGEKLTLKVEQEHQEVNELVVALEAGEHEGDDRAQLLTRLATVLREDVRDEEEELLPRLQQAVSARELRRLGVAWRLVARIAPTRPHPVVARRPPGNVLAALPLTAVDRSRDALDFLARRTTRGSRTLQSVSGLLARGAGRIEELPIMRRGEHRSTSRPAPGRD